MKVYSIHYPEQLPLPGMPDKQILAIGDFDGLHRGHREVIARAIAAGKARNLPVAVMTFHPHPRALFGHTKYEQCLTPPDVKHALMKEMGVDFVYVFSFHREFSVLSPAQFVQDILLPLGIDTVIVGFDFSFGYQGKGTPDTLSAMGLEHFSVEVVRPFHQDGRKVSSTLVRECLEEGRMEEANLLLGRPYKLRGHVVEGRKLGRTIGFPTANLEFAEPYVLPKLGVYAVKVHVKDGRIFSGAANLGVKPTVEGEERKPALEVHLLDYEGDLYGEELSIELLHFIRPERKFPSFPDLVKQIGMDVEQIRQYLKTGDMPSLDA